MASPARRLTFGPWPQGMILEDYDAERDYNPNPQAVQELVNLDVTDDGELVNRAGCQRVGVRNTHYTDATRVCRVLGSVFEDGSLQAVLGIVVSGTSTKIYLTPDGYTLNYFGSIAEPISSVQQYNNVIYLIRSDTGTPTTGGFYIAAGNFFTAGVPNATTALGAPSGDKTFIFKDRLFIVDKSSSTIYFSAPTDPTDYTVDSGGGFFIVNPANDIGTGIHDVVLTNETFYIFKRNQTFLFAYDANPNDDGVLRLINSALGAFSATVWENDIYVVNTQGVYRIVNGIFIRMDEPLDLRQNANLSNVLDPASLSRPLFIHAYNNKLLLGQFGNDILNKYGWNYVSMNLTNGAWTGYKYFADGAAPGSQGTIAQKDDTWGCEIFSSKNGEYFLRIPLVSGAQDYSLDGRASDTTEQRYIPNFAVKFYPYNAGYASIFKKIHRYFLRGVINYLTSAPAMGSISIETRADKSADTDATTTWSITSDQVSLAKQSEIKLPLPQQRVRNFTMKISSAGELTGRLYTAPDVGASDYTIIISDFSFDISFPRGMSPV